MQDNELSAISAGFSDFLSRRLIFVGAVWPDPIRDFGKQAKFIQESVEGYPSFVDALRVPQDYFDREWD